MKSLLLSNVSPITLLVCVMQMLLSPNRDHNRTVHNRCNVLVVHPIWLISPHIGLNTFLHVIPRNITFSHLLFRVLRQHLSHTQADSLYIAVEARTPGTGVGGFLVNYNWPL